MIKKKLKIIQKMFRKVLKKNKKEKIFILIGITLSVVVGGTYSATIYDEPVEDYYLDTFANKGVPVLLNDNVSTDIPEYTQPDSSQTNLDIKYRIGLLPEQYQDKQAYFIFPKAGTIIPVLEPNARDKAKLIKGETFNHLPYLQQGAIHHRGVSPSKGPGNFTIAGHTSYYKNDTGDFKTNMQGIILADSGDIVMYIEKQKNNTFNRYIYTVTKSYETDTKDTSILLAPTDPQQYEFTAYGCSPIGSMQKRRVIKGFLNAHDQVER